MSERKDVETIEDDAARASADARAGVSSVSPLDELPVADLRRYSIVGEVAKGGVGRILEAEDRTLKRRVAVKELRVGGRGQARFAREALVTARLEHPSIVPLYELGKWDSGEPYYTMRLVTGRPFDEVIAKTTS